MNKGIYLDKRTNKWYISTRIKINDEYKTCTIRGYNSKKEADLDYNNAVAIWKRKHLAVSNRNLYEKVVDEYLEWVRNGKANRTVDRERTQLNTYWNVLFTNQTIENIYDLERLNYIYKSIFNSEEMNIRKKHDVVKTFLQFSYYCLIQKYITKEMYDEVCVLFQPIKYTKRVANEHQVIPETHINALLSVIPESDKDLVMFSFFVALGCRLSEFLAIDIQSLDLDTNRVTIKKQRLPSGELTEKLKTSNSYRVVPFKKEMSNLLREYIYNCDIKGLLFTTSHTDFRRKLNEYEKKAGIPLYSSHDFRHTKCFEMAKKCQTISDVVYCAKVMGHSTDIFLNTYCNHLDKSLEEKFL